MIIQKARGKSFLSVKDFKTYTSKKMTKIACLLDPEEFDTKKLIAYVKIRAGVKHASLFFIGGSTSTNSNDVEELIRQIYVQDHNATVWLFPSSIDDLLTDPIIRKVVSYVLVPIPVNSQLPDLIFHTQVKYMRALSKFSSVDYIAYLVASSTSTVGKITEARDLSHDEVLDYVRLIISCGFSRLYLEGGSGGVFDKQLLHDVHTLWRNSFYSHDNDLFIYGGGIDSPAKLAVAQKIMRHPFNDIIVVGNKFEEVFK